MQILWLGLLLAAAGPGEPTAVSVAELCQGLRDRESAISNFSVFLRKTVRMHPLTKPDKLVSLHEELQIIADSSGRGRYEGRRQSYFARPDGKEEISENLVLGAFDGKRCRTAEGLAATRFSKGEESDARQSLSWGVDPWEYLTHYLGRPVSQIIAERGGQIVARGAWEGRGVLVVETAPGQWHGPPSARGKARFLIDPARNFVVVERSGLVQWAPELDWAVYTRIAGFEHVEAAPGIWVPRRIVYESLDPTAETVRNRKPAPLLRGEEVVAEKWRINEPLSESVFEIRFPPGVTVNDRITGRMYQVAQIRDQALADEAAGALHYVAPRRLWGRWKAWVAMPGLVAVMGLVVWVWRRARRRRKRGPTS